jgi:hypothetical protein
MTLTSRRVGVFTSMRTPLGFILRGLILPLALSPAGCSHAPAQDVLGSFFPAWLLCGALGILATVIIRVTLGAAGIEPYVPAPPLTYIVCAIAATLAIWLTWFGQ